MNELQDIGASLGFEPLTDSASLSIRLDGLITGATLLTVEQAAVRQIDEVFFAIAHIQYRKKVGDNNHKTVRETVVLLEVPGTVFPHLAIQPRSFGTWLLEKAAGLMGLKEVDFPSHEAYDKSYSTFTFMPDEVRRLMDEDVLTYLTERPGLSVQTSDDRVLVFRQGKLLAGDELTALVDDAQGLLSRLTAAARRLLDEGWNPQEAATRMTENMGGMVGRMMRGRLVMRQQAEEFVAQNPPRELPANIKKSFVSFSSGLRSASLIALVFHLLVTAAMVAVAVGGQLETGPAIGIIAILALMLAGIVTAFYFANRFHRKRVRLLREGELVLASVVSVRESSVSINDQRRFNVELEYRAAGQSHRKTVNAYGQSVQLAQSLLQSGEETSVLVDPQDPENILWTGMLVTWNA